MRFCADTWFLTKVSSKDIKADKLLRSAEEGKDWILIPLTVFAEMSKKMLAEGTPKEKVKEFFDQMESIEKVKLIFPNREIASEAARTSLSYKLSLLDSFVAATAKITGCDVLLSADSDYKLIQKQKYLKLQSWQ